MKRKDGGNGRRQIWGVFLSFAAFYLCAMLLLTFFQALEKKKIMTEAARENVSRLAAKESCPISIRHWAVSGRTP